MCVRSWRETGPRIFTLLFGRRSRAPFSHHPLFSYAVPHGTEAWGTIWGYRGVVPDGTEWAFYLPHSLNHMRAPASTLSYEPFARRQPSPLNH
jgi:hypothetical protein